MKKRRYIVHIDMDAFFAAIEQRDNPAYRLKPVVVGADPKGGRGRGVVSTCSYEARRYGIHSAMPISIAYRKCPHAIFLGVDMDKYSAVSDRIYSILYKFTPDIEPVSIDEAFLDITGSYHLFRTPIETCLLIKKEIKKETGLIASCGLAPTKMAAKIASDLKKPDGMVEVPEEGLLGFLWPLSVRKIWGLGEKTEKILNSMGIYTIGDLAKRDPKEIAPIFGKNGEELLNLANGMDERPVLTEGEAKSISNENTFESDTIDKEKVKGVLMALSEKVSGRLRHENLKARTITLKIRLKGFRTYTRSATLLDPTNFTDMIYKEIARLYDGFEYRDAPVRLVGVKATNFSSSYFRVGLFEEETSGKLEKTHKAIDMITRRFGEGSIYRAGGRL